MLSLSFQTGLLFLRVPALMPTGPSLYSRLQIGSLIVLPLTIIWAPKGTFSLLYRSVTQSISEEFLKGNSQMIAHLSVL